MSRQIKGPPNPDAEVAPFQLSRWRVGSLFVRTEQGAGSAPVQRWRETVFIVLLVENSTPSNGAVVPFVNLHSYKVDREAWLRLNTGWRA